MVFGSLGKFVGRSSAMNAALPSSPSSPPSTRTMGPLDADLDMSALGATLWRKRWKIFGPAILVGLITLLVVQVITPRYQSQSRVFIEGADNVYLRPDADRNTAERTVAKEGGTSRAT